MNRYKELYSKKKETGGSDSSESNKIMFFNPNREFGNENSYWVRVLPSGEDFFYFEYKKHQFKIGTTWKNCLCAESFLDPDKGITSCPICDFLRKNSKSVARSTWGKMGAHTAYTCFIYNYAKDAIQRFDFDQRMYDKILEQLMKLNNGDGPDDSLVDSQGFELQISKNADGYGDPSKVAMPEVTIDEIVAKSAVFKSIPSIREKVSPWNAEALKNTASAILSLGIQAFEPDLVPELEERDSSSRNKRFAKQSESHVDAGDDWGTSTESQGFSRADLRKAFDSIDDDEDMPF